MDDMKTRPLTPKERAKLRNRITQMNLRYGDGRAARKIGISPETLIAALGGKRIQPAKRAILLKDDQ